MSKRRVFDIDFPSDEMSESTSVPAGTDTDRSEKRRGPMASAISENADALRERALAEQAIREENDRLAHEHVRLKRDGLITDLVPLDEILTTKLTRDRSQSVDPDLQELKTSIREIGLSNPIRIESTKTGYQLVQGYRRLSAFRALYEETKDEKFARIPAGIVSSDEALAILYRRMVDENLVRRDLSFAEMAQLARACATDLSTGFDSVDAAVNTLYASAGRQKRSYIRHFASLLDQMGDQLQFPEAIPRKLGLDLVRQMGFDSELVYELREALKGAGERDSEAELSILREELARSQKPKQSDLGQGGSPKAVGAKTSLRCNVPAGTVRCTAKDGKVELAMKRDFSEIDHGRLEAAVAAFMAALDQE